jgi:hypothetical protein
VEKKKILIKKEKEKLFTEGDCHFILSLNSVTGYTAATH